jgi:hypothetical protein
MSDLFTEPVDFNEAMLRREVRAFIPTDLTHEQLKAVGSQVRERSLMMARVTNVEFGERVRGLTIDVAEGRMSSTMARRRLSDLLGEMGYMPEPGEEGTIKDLRSDARLNLIIRMQVQFAHGFGQWRMRQTTSELWANPCQELYRAYARKEPRDWLTRWQDAGGELYDGRMIAPVNAMIWTDISAFGLPYPPFDFNSGMDLKPVSREEAIDLGAFSEHQVVHPEQRDFEDDGEAHLPELSKEMEGVLVDSLGEGWTYEDGVLHKANERLIQQLLNNDFLTDNNIVEIEE